MDDIKWVHIIFMTFLAAAAWQDLRNKSVSVWLYLGYGAVAGVIRLTGGEPVLQALSGGLVGVVLLAADRRCDRNWRWLVFRGQRALLKLL